MAAPMDLSILYDKNKANLERKVLTAFKLGYSAVAINYVTDRLTNIPRAEHLKVSEEKVKELGIRRDLRQYTRLTVVVTEKTSFTRMLQPDIQAFDIIAVRPTSEKLFQIAAVTLDVDIISFDMTETVDFPFSHKMIKKARLRHTYFEICYSPAIRDKSLRKKVFANSSNLVFMRGATNTIVSSNCETVAELRAPKDVMNLGMLFGLNELQAKDAVTTHTRAVIVRAYSRRGLMKRVMDVEKITEKGEIGEKVASKLPDLPIDEADLEDESDSDLEEGRQPPTTIEPGKRKNKVGISGNKNKKMKT